jgi:hypothetical protein
VSDSNRRHFIASVGALAAGSVLPSAIAAGQAAQGWDMTWVDRLTGKHRQVFDMADMELGLLVVKNWVDAWETVYGLKHPEVNAIVGIAGKAFPVNASDALYEKYPIGEQWRVNDPVTSQPAKRNVHLAGDGRGMFAGAGVRPLQARGVVFWMCNNALLGAAGRLAAAVQRPQAEVYQDLRAGLNPGVILVPAHTMLLGICQERGCTYEML